MRPRQPTACRGLHALLGYVASNRNRIAYQEPWHQGLAVGSGSVEGACKHVIQARSKRAGMRWKRQGSLLGFSSAPLTSNLSFDGSSPRTIAESPIRPITV